ncbi:MAG: CBS domain-containing protein [Nitrososphaerota archaeon]|nr:CBS domain-containing protein [Nitrososphaerota archaeon]
MVESKDVVGKIISKTIRTVSVKQPISLAVAEMTKHNIGSVVVVKDGAPVGIITESDVMRQLVGKGGKDLDEPSEALASKPLVAVPPDTEIWEAFMIMLRRKIRRLPVTQDGKLVGIVTERDLFKWVVSVLYEPNVPEDVRKLVAQNP